MFLNIFIEYFFWLPLTQISNVFNTSAYQNKTRVSSFLPDKPQHIGRATVVLDYCCFFRFTLFLPRFFFTRKGYKKRRKEAIKAESCKIRWATFLALWKVFDGDEGASVGKKEVIDENKYFGQWTSGFYQRVLQKKRLLKFQKF